MLEFSDRQWQRIEQCESRRLACKPKSVKVLFVGESIPYAEPSEPLNANFFYHCNSDLYRHTREAFAQAYETTFQDVCSEEDNSSFIGFLRSQGCYLADLCAVPVNNHKLKDPRRLDERARGVSSLALNISNWRPRAIVVVMKDILGYVVTAACKAEIGPISYREVSYDYSNLICVGIGPETFVYALPFPTRSEANKRNYKSQLAELIPTLPLEP